MSSNPFADLIPVKSAGISPTPANPGISRFDAILDSFNLGAEKLPHGILQLVGNLTAGKNNLANKVAGYDITGNISRGSGEVASQRQNRLSEIKAQYPYTGMLSELGGGVVSSAPLMAIPGAEALPLVGRGAGFVEPVTSGIAQGAATGASEYVNPDESRLMNTGIGGILGGGAGGLFHGIGILGNKAYNAVKGVFTDPQKQAMYELAKQHNVPISASDIMSDNPIIKSFGSFIDKVPFIGTRGFRQKQMEGAKSAAEDVTDQFRDIMDTMDYGGRTGMKRLNDIAQGGNGNRAKQARNLLEEINNSDHDWNQIMQTSGNFKLFRSKMIADRKYDRVAEIADQFGDVNTSNIDKAVNNMIRQENKSVLKNEGLLGLLGKIKQGLNEEVPGTPASGILDEMGNPLTAEIPAAMSPVKMNFTQLRQFRSDLSDRISDYFKGDNAAIGRKGAGALQAIKDQIDLSLNKFAQSNGNMLKTAWQNADDFYKTAVVPAKDRKLAQALKNDDPDMIYTKFITTGSREGGKGTGRAQRFYNALDNKGRAAVRYGMVSDAFEHALKDDGQFSPAQFAGYLERFTTAKNVVFNATEKAEIDGFKNLMRSVQRSFQELNLPDTGVKSIPYVLAGAATTASPKTMASIAGVTYATKLLFTTDAGKRFLLASSRLKENSPAFQNAVNVFNRMIQSGIEQQGIGMVQDNPSIQNIKSQLGVSANDTPVNDSSSPFSDLIPAG